MQLMKAMAINFCHSKLLAKTCCSCISADGRDVSNLVASDSSLRAKVSLFLLNYVTHP